MGNQWWTIQRNWQHRVAQAEDKHNTICVGHHYTQTNTTQYVLDTTIHKQTQHNMCWTPLYTNKHNTICVGHHYTQTNTINVTKTWTLLEVKTKQTSFLCWNRNGHHKEQGTSRHITGKHKKLKRWATQTPSQNQGWTQVFVKGKQSFL
jgi:hypothetical protein